MKKLICGSSAGVWHCWGGAGIAKRGIGKDSSNKIVIALGLITLGTWPDTTVFKKTALNVFFWRMLALLLTGNGKLRHGVGKGMGFSSVQHLDLSI